ncbi:MAG: hypothetical protein ACI4PE_03775 [Bacilli bacterium]
MVIFYTYKANQQIDSIISNDSIYDEHGHFTQQFINWNDEFHRYVNPNSICQNTLFSKGVYNIGTIGSLSYKLFEINGNQVFEIIEFHFKKLPYSKSTKRYEIIFDAGYGYKIIRSTKTNKCAILTPQKTMLTKFAFDDIIGFHHSSDNYNEQYAIGFIGDRVYYIKMNGEVILLHLSKEDYLSMEHKFYESYNISPTKLCNLITESIMNRLNII